MQMKIIVPPPTYYNIRYAVSKNCDWQHQFQQKPCWSNEHIFKRGSIVIMSSKVNAACRGSHICKKSQEIGKCIIPLPTTSDPLASGHAAVYRCVSAACTRILINTHPGRQTGGSGCSCFPLRPLGVHSSCPVLTGLEVAVRLQRIVGRMRHVSLGAAHARPTAGRAEKGMGRRRESERGCVERRQRGCDGVSRAEGWDLRSRVLATTTESQPPYEFNSD